MPRRKKKTFNKKDLKKRPIKVVYPYMCPFCDELSYPDSETNFKPLRLPEETFSQFKCMSGHTFYVYEKIVANQDWADKKCNDARLRDKSNYWKRQLRENRYGVEDMKE